MTKQRSRPALSFSAFLGGRRTQSGRVGLAVICMLVMLNTIGCTEEGVSRHRVPKERPPQRLLGAIIPHKDRTWFFKLVGPHRAIDQHQKDFEQFINSVRFTDKGQRPVTWKVPEGW